VTNAATQDMTANLVLRGTGNNQGALQNDGSASFNHMIWGGTITLAENARIDSQNSGRYTFNGDIGQTGGTHTLALTLGGGPNAINAGLTMGTVNHSGNGAVNFGADSVIDVGTWSSSAGTGSISVSASSSTCSWTASESVDWIAIASGSSGTGDGTVTYEVSANTTSSERTAVITVDGESHTVTQDPQLSAPTLLFPQNNAVMDNNCEDYSDSIDWAFSWNSFSGATRYQIYVIGPYPIVNPIIDTIVTSTSFNFSGTGYITDANRLNWTWRVRAGNDRNEWSVWSQRSFDVEPVNTDCPCPDLIVESIARPIWDAENQRSVIQATIRNIGNTSVGTTLARVVDPTTFQHSGAPYNSVSSTPVLAPGASTTVIFYLPYWVFNPDVTLEVTADYKNEVSECDEQNNVKIFDAQG